MTELKRDTKIAITAREAGGSVEPGVERSGTPGKQLEICSQPAKRAAVAHFAFSAEYVSIINDQFLIRYRPLRGLAAIFAGRILGLTPQSLRRRPLGGLSSEAIDAFRMSWPGIKARRNLL